MSHRHWILAVIALNAACLAGRQPGQHSQGAKPTQSDAPFHLKIRQALKNRQLIHVAHLLQEAHRNLSLKGLNEEGEALSRLHGIVKDLDIANRPLRESDLYRGEEAALWVENALEAYMKREDDRAMLFAQAALGADSGNEARRILLKTLSQRTGIEIDSEGILPVPALIHHELRRADLAFFEQRFGAAIQSCHRALGLDQNHIKAWVRLGSAHYALGQHTEARSAYERALELDPQDSSLRNFLKQKGWE